MSSSSPSTASSSSSTSHLSNSPLNLLSLRDFFRSELGRLLLLPAPATTKKALVLDRTVSGPLGLVAEVELLKSHGVDQIHHLKAGELHTPCTQVIYLVRPTLDNMRIIAAQVLAARAREAAAAAASASAHRRQHTLLFTPRRSILAEQELERLGVLGDLQHIQDFHLGMIPFDEDVLSMEVGEGFKSMALDGDPSILNDVARSLIQIQILSGGWAPIVKGKGPNAVRVWQLMQRLRREGGFQADAGRVVGSSGSATAAAAAANSASSYSNEIDSIIILDRSVDLVTPLLTQTTYEGLLDELIGIKNSYIDAEADIVPSFSTAAAVVKSASSSSSPSSSTPPAGGSPSEKPKKLLLLNSADSLFKETRDLNFRVLGPLLHRKAEYIAKTYSSRHSAQTVTEMHEFMKRFKSAHNEHNLLQTHIRLAEKCSQVFKSKIFDRRLEIERWMLEGEEVDQCEEYIEAAIAKSEPLSSVLRLFCLLSLTSGGVRSKKFDVLRRDVLHTYGYTELFTLGNLEKLGMLCLNGSNRALLGGRNFGHLRRPLRLLPPGSSSSAGEPPKVDVQNPTDINYVYNGYAPLSVRVIEAASKPGWRRLEDVLALVPGRMFEYRQDASSVNPTPQNLLELKNPTAIAAATQGLTGADGNGEKKESGGTASASGSATSPASGATASSDTSAGRKKPLSLVVFLGGVTHSEISALRFLSEKEDHGRDYIVATTKILNGSHFLDSLQEVVVNKLANVNQQTGGRRR